MATRSNIAVKNTDGSFDTIYCHWDGYPSHNGEILKSHYADMDKVNALMKLGSLSSLGQEIGEKHDFYQGIPESKSWCTAYFRDRNEPKESTRTRTRSFNDLMADDYVDYLYVFDGEFWNCYDTYTKKSINLYQI